MATIVLLWSPKQITLAYKWSHLCCKCTLIFDNNNNNDLQGIASATIEAGCECFLFFYVFLVFPPSVVVFLMSGISFGTAIYQTYKLGRYCGRRAEYEAMHNTDENHVFRKLGSCVRSLLIGCNVVGGFLQIAGIIAISILISLFLHDSKAIITTTVKWSIGCVLCLCLLLLSVIWSSALQKWTFTSRQPQSRVRSEGDNHNTKSSETARYKASKLPTFPLY